MNRVVFSLQKGYAKILKKPQTMKIRLLFFTFLCSFLSWGQVTIFSETVGNTGTGTLTIAGTTFDNTGLTFTGNADTRTTSPSSGYAGVSGLRNVFITGTAGQNFEISGINTSAYTALQLTFGELKSGAAGAANLLVVEVSSDGLTYNPLTYSRSDGAVWALISPTGTIPSTSNLRIRFRNPATTQQFRVDDIVLKGTLSSSNTITTNTALTGSPFCVNASTGASVSVPFTSVGTFNAGNVYTAQLSNAAGSFASPVSIGTVTSVLNTDVISATIPAGTAAGAGYRIRVVSSNPVVTGSDNTVNLTVQNSAAITTQPSTTVQNLCQSIAATALSVVGTGTTLTYQWYSNTSNSNSGGTLVAGATSASYTPSTATAGTLYYYCVVTASCGAPVTSNVSGAINVTATPSTPAGTINISANPSCGAATLSYSAPSATIYWQTSATGTATTNPTTSNYTSSATAGSYIIYVRELSGSCWSAATSSGSFTVVAPVNITAQPPNRVITDGNNTTFTVTATGSSLTYQWQVDTTGTGTSFVDLTNGAPYSTVTTSSLTITAAPLSMNGYLYRCVVSGAAPCGSVTSNSGSLTVSLTAPNNPSAIVPCYGNTTLGLSWTASSGGSAPDGYMVFALAGATTPAATSAAAGNASLYTANSDFSLATVVTASLGKCIYKGTGTSVTVTGLTNLSNYSFKVVAYRGTTGTAWSTGINSNGTWNTPTTNIVIDMPEVTALAASIAGGQSALTWNRPTPLACYDQYLVVANQGAVVFTPSGDGTAYSPNTVYSGPNQVVYNGTGAGVTVTGLTNGTNYCYKVFVRRGTEWSDGVSVCQTPNIVYCALTATNTSFEHISNVTVGADINNNTASSGYADYTAQIANTTISIGTPISVTITPSYTTDNVYVYIDWNKDGDWLDAGENIAMTYTAATTTFTATGTITPPVSALIGTTRMRVIVVDGTVSNACNGGANFTYGEVEDYTINVISACVPTHTVTSFTPTSGPVGTEVTINGTGLTGATVTFSGVNATILSNSGTQIVAVVPATATTGILSVKDSQPCTIDNGFTVISNVNTSCEGAAVTTDLIIYDIHDEYTGSGGFITFYNGTAATVNMTNYTLWRTTDHDNGAEIDYANLTGTIASGALGIIKVSVGSCGPASTNGTIDGGFNNNDGIQLRNAAGTVIIDDVDTYPTGAGYYMVRNTGALSARTSYVAADWSTIPLADGVCYPSAGLTLPTATGTTPLVTTQPSYLPSCGATSATLTTAGTEGFAGGLSLTYQWFFVAPGNTTWTAVTDGGIYSGATTAALNISNVTTVLNYQYYCQIRENLATCYSATNAVKITDTNASTWNGTTWIGGTPTITKAAIIDGTYVTATNGDFSCCSLTVNATKTLTISSGGYVEVQNNITNNGTLTVLNSGSLVQVSDSGVNTGNIQYNRTANIRKLDYVYWSSPVTGFASNAVSPGTNLGYQYKWLPTTAGINNFGNWTLANETMVLGKGYIVRGPDSFSTSVLTNYNATFTGVPNNGVISIPISRGTYIGGNYSTGVSNTLGTKEDDNWNLVGNPYPSAIHAINFLTLNTNIDGFVNIWTHGTLPANTIANPFYNTYAYNYTPTDYITYNASGASSGPGVFNGKIAGGQGFFVSMLDTSAATTENLIFNNSLRSIAHNNGQFFKTSSASSTVSDNLERNRIWLDIVSASGSSIRSLFGYIEGASDGKDRLYDAFSNEKLSFNIYSLINEEQMLIQGRKLPFDSNDKVDIGVAIPQDGLYKIAISAVDGLFSNVNQKIYLEDKLLNVIYDLRTAPYSFMANKGVINNRFVIRYTNNVVLTNPTFDAENEVVVISNHDLQVYSNKEKLSTIIVYDVLGRKLFEGKNVNTTNFTIPISQREVPLFIEIGLENGAKINRKVIY